jgi:RNA polymerase sigma factor (sigma-70 family)
VTDPTSRGESANYMDQAAKDRADPRMARFQAIYRSEFEFVWATALRLGVPPAAAEDVAQEVFLIAYRRLEALRYEVSPRGWLHGVTRRVASRHRRGAVRRARRLASLAEMTPRAIDLPHPRHEAVRRLAQLLEQLGAGTREVWEMTELLGMSGPEIAGELALPLNTVYSRLRLARTRLQELLGGPETVAEWTEELRRYDAPPPDAERRTWAVLLPALGNPAAGPLVATWVAARAAVATTLIVAGAALGLAALPGADPPPTPPAERAPAVVHPPPPRAPAAVPPTPTATTGTPAPTRAARVRPGGLDAEVALLDRARAALAADAPDDALAWVDAHAREFPRGSLADAREGARVDALCMQGRAVEAEAAARRLLAQRPDSPLTRRFADFRCVR